MEHGIDVKKAGLIILEDGVCSICHYADRKQTDIDWDERGKKLINFG